MLYIYFWAVTFTSEQRGTRATYAVSQQNEVTIYKFCSHTLPAVSPVSRLTCPAVRAKVAAGLLGKIAELSPLIFHPLQQSKMYQAGCCCVCASWLHVLTLGSEST